MILLFFLMRVISFLFYEKENYQNNLLILQPRWWKVKMMLRLIVKSWNSIVNSLLKRFLCEYVFARSKYSFIRSV